MVKNKKGGKGEAANGSAAGASNALIICRNKHWRYISSFHGPWLQLPPEVLDTLANANWYSARPRPMDPAVFFDLAKIRRAVDEATNLAVRAASGLTSQALSSSLNAGHGLVPSAALLGIGGGGGTSTLSRERKHRMRELATSKLSYAYRLDEIAASVATMQGASALEDVASLVLQRNPSDVDAQYVHFFHEKIPSRMMAECTPYDALDKVVDGRLGDGSPLRTRAITASFKDDPFTAVSNLTEALAAARSARPHNNQLVVATHNDQTVRNHRQDQPLPEHDQPRSLEPQLLFHRAGVYLTIAVGYIDNALRPIEGEEAARHQMENRQLVRKHAKRALRDYMAFIGHFDYTAGITQDIYDEVLRCWTAEPTPSSAQRDRLFEATTPILSESGALIPLRRNRGSKPDRSLLQDFPAPGVFKVNQLFEPAPPPELPPFPPPLPRTPAESAAATAAAKWREAHERLTYHPLLPDALHSLLLCHALLQTPPKELLRHALNTARLARVCDGYPIFLAARSPARSDWIECLRYAHNWIGIPSSWEDLCRPAPLSNDAEQEGGSNGSELTRNSYSRTPAPETEAQKRERQKHEAILEALADDRVVDEATFHRAVRAHQQRAEDDKRAADVVAAPPVASEPSSSGPASPVQPPQKPQRWAQHDLREYPITTDRAEAIARWVVQAPEVVDSGRKRRPRAKGKGKKKGIGAVSDGVEALAESVETLGISGEE